MISVPDQPIPDQQPAGIGQFGIILGVWAHPGDDALFSAGLMALARAAGSRVVVVTATRGEQGTTEPARWPPERLAQLRSDELAASLAVLGVNEHRWLSFPHRACDDVPPDAGAEQIRRLLDEVAPDAIVTFGPDGAGNSDHQAVSAWTTAAWESMGRGPSLLYTAGSPVPSPPAAQLTAGPAMVRIRLAEPVLELKRTALRAYCIRETDAGCAIECGGFPELWQEELFQLHN